jgi:hypothetical protein
MAEEQGGAGVIPLPEAIRDRMAETREALDQRLEQLNRRLLGLEATADQGDTPMAAKKRTKKKTRKSQPKGGSKSGGARRRATKTTRKKASSRRTSSRLSTKAAQVLGEVLAGAAAGAVTGAVRGAAQAVPAAQKTEGRKNKETE